jgi:hypothetical protein
MYICPDRIGASTIAGIAILSTNAGIAQLVERNLAKVDVAGSSPVSRSVPGDRDRGLPVIAPGVSQHSLPL